MNNVIPLAARRQQRQQRQTAVDAAVVQDTLAWCFTQVLYLKDPRRKQAIADYLLKALVGPPKAG